MISSVRRNKSRKKGSRRSPAGNRNGHAPQGHTPQGQPPNGHAAQGQHRSLAMQVNVLALNRNYVAVHVLTVPRAFSLLWKGTAEVVNVEQDQYLSYDFDGWREISELKAELEEREDTDDWIRSVQFEIQVPKIIRLLRYDRVPRNSVKFNRRNIFLRDGHCCQYCRKRFPRQQLSLDHVMPRSRGGGDSWENVVCACLACNVRKGGRTPHEAGMALNVPPVRPKRSPLISRQMTEPKYESWGRFVRLPE